MPYRMTVDCLSTVLLLVVDLGIESSVYVYITTLSCAAAAVSPLLFSQSICILTVVNLGQLLSAPPLVNWT